MDARIVIASVDTYLRFAEAVNRLNTSLEKAGLTEIVGNAVGPGMEKRTRQKIAR